MDFEQWHHNHSFAENKEHIEKKTLIVVLITFTMMIGEIIFGLITNSMALFADGIHMGTHAFALGISLFAYILARKHKKNQQFVFGTWKIEILGAYSSALILGVAAFIMIYSSIERIIFPLPILYDQALVVAVIGLLINLVCAFILNAPHHEHKHSDNSDHHHHHEDLNLRSAYLHVASDALTSILAIIALLGAKYYNSNILDPLMGIAGAILISRWSFYLLKDSSKILLDYNTNLSLAGKIKEIIESDGQAKITDLHLWKVSDRSYSCIVALVSENNYSSIEYKKRLDTINELAHITVEVN